jgi:hypothetical protein
MRVPVAVLVVVVTIALFPIMPLLLSLSSPLPLIPGPPVAVAGCCVVHRQCRVFVLVPSSS